MRCANARTTNLGVRESQFLQAQSTSGQLRAMALSMPSGRDYRRFPRVRTKDLVRVRFQGVTRECSLTDKSQGGVGLMLRAGEELPDQFTIELSGGKVRQAEIVWRGYPRCGAVFRD